MHDTRYTVRLATPDDAAALSAIASRTFAELVTQVHATPADDLALYVATAFPVEKIVEEIQDPMRTTLLLFPEDDPLHPCGYSVIRDCSIRSGDELLPQGVNPEDYVEIKRVYVDSAFHGKGASYVLMEHVMQLVRKKNRKIVWLGTSPGNERAKKFYEKHGFTITGKHLFHIGTKSHWDIVLTLQ